MKFIKSNWLKLTLAVIFLVSSILILIPNLMVEHFEFIGACQSIGFILFFFGIALVIGLAMFNKTKYLSKYFSLGTGILALTFLSIGMTGLKKTDSKGVMGKSYSYFAVVEKTVKEGEITIAEKQAEMDAKKAELEAAKADIAALGALAVPAAWDEMVGGFTTAGLFGTMVSDSFVPGVTPATTLLRDIVANPAITYENNPTAYISIATLMGAKAKLVGLGLGAQTLQTAQLVVSGMVAAFSQSFPQLEEAIAQLQGVIDMNAAELAKGKKQINDANIAAYTIMFLYVSLMLGMGVAPILIGGKKVFCKEAE